MREREWFVEGTVPGVRHGKIEHGFAVERVLYEGRSDHQDVLIFDNAVYGRVMVLDGIVQFSSLDEQIYHEMLVHPVALAHGRPRRICIIGGGDGGTLRECLKHEPERVTLVDLDPGVIQLSREHLAEHVAGAFDDPRVELIHADGVKFVAEVEEPYDLVIVDGGDYSGLSAQLMDVPFFESIRAALGDDGMMSIQVGSVLDRELLDTCFSRLSQVFAEALCLRLCMASYHCGEYCFQAASKRPGLRAPDRDAIRGRHAALTAAHRLRYYTPEVHAAAQVCPPDWPTA